MVKESTRRSMGFGIVAKANKGSFILEVFPVAEMPTTSGSLVKSGDGKNITEVVWTNRYSPHRVVAPHMQPGEVVALTENIGTDVIEWSFHVNDVKLRKQEHVLTAYSNVKEKDDKEVSEETSLYSEVDTIEGFARLVTPVNNGEPAVFDISVDYKNGILNISANGKEIITYNYPKNVLDINVKNEVNINTKKATITAETAIVDSKSTTVTASDNITLNAPSTNINANVNINGNVNVKGSGKFSGGLKAATTPNS